MRTEGKTQRIFRLVFMLLNKFIKNRITPYLFLVNENLFTVYTLALTPLLPSVSISAPKSGI